MRNVGKVICGTKYIHKSAFTSLDDNEKQFINSKIDSVEDFCALGTFLYDIIKFNIKENKLSLIQSPDWDSATEPTVGDSVSIKNNGTLYFKKSNNKQIYHHKWLFVCDDYAGFDVKKSKWWSNYWEYHPYILKLKNEDKYFKSKIGNKSYFEKILKNIKK